MSYFLPLKDANTKKSKTEIYNCSNITDKITIKTLSKIEIKKQRLISKQKSKKITLQKIEEERLETACQLNKLKQELEKQQRKLLNIEEGDDISGTESLTFTFTQFKTLQNGLEILYFVLKNNIYLKKYHAFTKIVLHAKENNPVIIISPPTPINLNQKQLTIYDNNNNITQSTNGDMVNDKSSFHKSNTIKSNILTINNNYVNDKHKPFQIKEIRKKTTFAQSQLRDDEKEGILNLKNDSHIHNNIRIQCDHINISNEMFDDDDIENSNSNLIEYDKFYKENFFKNELFKFDAKFKDKEEDDIKKENMKIEMKKNIQNKIKQKEINLIKGINTDNLEKEIIKLQDEYKQFKKSPPNVIELQMNNIDGLLYKGRLLNNYFTKQESSNIPKFTIQNERYIKGKEIIDFKPLNKEEQVRRMYDKYPCFKYRKKMYKWFIYVKYYCNLLVDNYLFEHLSLMIIIINTVFILFSDPRNPKSFANKNDSVFLYFYSIECTLKIIGLGFIFEEHAYLKDYWNVLDFFVIIIGWISFILERLLQDSKQISGLAGLRSFRILRPLKTVKSIKGLKRLVTALLASLSKLSDISIVLFFFFLLFAIGGVQMWQGLFLRRCMNLQFGYIYSYQGSEAMCTYDSDCKEYNSPGNVFVCVKGFINPHHGITTFDNTITGFMTIFIIATLEGWTEIFTFVSKTFKDKFSINQVIIFMYFHVFVFVGGFYLINLFLAVTNSEFENIERMWKELASKKSFYELVKGKYDLKEQEKLEKKEKEKERKQQTSKEINNNDDESLNEMKYKLNEEAFHIKKNPQDIPVNYTTIKDMYILQNNNPEELNKIDQMIKNETKYLENDLSKQIKELERGIKEKKKNINKSSTLKFNDEIEQNKQLMLLSSPNNISVLKFKNSSNSIVHRNETQLSRPIMKIYPIAIEIAIANTENHLQIELTKLQRKPNQKRNEISNLLRYKLEKKEQEKLNMNQISIMEDLSFEKEHKTKIQKDKDNIKHIATKALFEIFSPRSLRKHNHHHNNNNNPQQHSILLNNISPKKAHRNNQIRDELSFMTDISLTSNHEEANADNNNNNNNTTHNKSYFKNLTETYLYSPIRNDSNSIYKTNIIDSSNEDNSSSFLTANNNIDGISVNNISNYFDIHKTVLEKKRIILNVNDNIESEVIFTKPNSNLINILQLKHDQIIKNKLDKMRQRFNINEYLQKKPQTNLATSTLGRRRSFLQFLQYENNNNNKQCFDFINKDNQHQHQHQHNLPPSLLPFNDNNNADIISINSKSLSDLSDLSLSLPEDNIVVKDELDVRDVVKNVQMNKLTENAKNIFLDKSYKKKHLNLNSNQTKQLLTNVNYKMNNNLVIDKKQPRGRDIHRNNLNVSHVFIPPNNNILFNDNNNNNNNTHTNNKNNFNCLSHLKTQHQQIKHAIQFPEFSFNSADSFLGEEEEVQEKEKHFYKSKSIDKNIQKYPIINSNTLLIEERNIKYQDISTFQQELIPYNLRSRKYYMNYLYNIKDKDIQVKDTFKINHWRKDILGAEQKEIPLQKLPESIDAIHVFNDKKLKLKKYKYLYNKQYTYQDNECAYLTHNLKNLPINILEIMPIRLRDFGKYAIGKEIHLGTLASKGQSNHSNTLNVSSSSKNGINSSFMNKNISSHWLANTLGANVKLQEDMKYKRSLCEKIHKKLDEFNYNTLSHYFLDEHKLYMKLTDNKHRTELIKQLEDNNNTNTNTKLKENIIEVKSEIDNIKIFDIRTNSCRYVQWSGQDVMYINDPLRYNSIPFSKEQEQLLMKYNTMISSLEEFGIIIWKRAPGIKQLQKIRFALYLISINPYFDIFIMILVITNAIIMAIDGNLFTPEVYSNISITNYVFNAIFIAEFVIKIIGLGPLVYFSDAFTYLDLIIIAFAILDMATPSHDTSIIGINKSITSQFGFLRVFRIFRVLRLTKILRKMKSMRMIIISITNSLANVTYIILILIMFLLIFQLLGMSLLNGNVRYQSFLVAFYTTFQVLTTENWNIIFYDVYPLNKFVFLYYLVWIVLGNYILFNLFISILLQSFDDSNDLTRDDDDEEEDDRIERMFTLPDYLMQLKLSDKEHQNRLKKVKNKKRRHILKRALINHTNTNNTNSLNASRVNTSINGYSSSFNISDSSHLLIETDDDNSNDEFDYDEGIKIVTEIDRNIKHWQKVNLLFRKNECENSLYLLSQVNVIRIWCMKICSSNSFEGFILVVIGLSSLRLILDTFIEGYMSVFVFDMIDIVFNVIFLFEMIIKVIALGFVMDEGSYIRDNWNKIDLVIVIVSLIDIQSLVEKYINNKNSKLTSLNFLKALRLLRTLRPLRFISHNIQLKLIITSLFDSILPICNALLIVMIVFFMFSIVGINLFYNLYHNCYVPGRDTPFKVADTNFAQYLSLYNISTNMQTISTFCAERYNGIMDTGPKFKFSNIFMSLVTSYVLGHMEGWPDIMNDHRMFNNYYGIFFVIYILVVSYFFLNLFTGIMFKYFNDAWSKEKKIGDNDKKAEKYFDFIKQIETADPEYTKYLSPEEGSVKYYLILIANSKYLDNFIMVIIILNTIVMAFNFDGTTQTYQHVLDLLNLIFTSIFIAECILKLCALGLYEYFYYGWNKFDFFVVITSIADLVIANINGINAAFLKSFQIIRVLRVLRVSRVLRLIKSLKSLEKLLQTLRWSVTALSNVFVLMFLIFCIFAILGCYLYDGIVYDKYKEYFNYINSFYNFDTFYNAFILCFRCATGEDWPSIMLELAYIDKDKVNPTQAYVFMIAMNFTSAIIMLNLFLMVTLQQYAEFTNKSYNPVEMFDTFLDGFKTAWNKYASSKDKGFRIKKLLVTNFLAELKWKKLRFPHHNELECIKKYVSDLNLKADQENYVYFHDVLFKIINKQMGAKVDKTLNSNVVLVREEKKVEKAINEKINKYIKKKKINKGKAHNPLSNFNPLTSHLYFKISFLYMKTFMKYYKENAENIKNNNFDFNLNEESENEEEEDDDDNDNDDNNEDNSNDSNSNSNNEEDKVEELN